MRIPWSGTKTEPRRVIVAIGVGTLSERHTNDAIYLVVTEPPLSSSSICRFLFIGLNVCARKESSSFSVVSVVAAVRNVTVFRLRRRYALKAVFRYFRTGYGLDCNVSVLEGQYSCGLETIVVRARLANRDCTCRLCSAGRI
jgi:hypothetical protein